jgi:polysaccharide export outer membrane protein
MTKIGFWRFSNRAKLGLALLMAAVLSQAYFATAQAEEQLVGYRLNAGDRIRLIVFNNPSLTGEFGVTDGGNLSLPLIGNVQVRGLAVEDAQALIRSKYADGYVVDPKVSLEVIAYRPFFILGEVQKPGEYPYSVGLTLPQAVAMAGGYSPRANRRHLFLSRADSTEQKVDIHTTVVRVQPGDTIRVGERYL